MKNCPPPGRSSDNINAMGCTSLFVKIIIPLIVSKGNGVWFPAIDSQRRRTLMRPPVVRQEVRPCACYTDRDGILNSKIATDRLRAHSLKGNSFVRTDNDAPFAPLNECQQMLDFGCQRKFLPDSLGGLAYIKFGEIENLICLRQRIERLAGKTTAAQPYNVQSFVR